MLCFLSNSCPSTMDTYTSTNNKSRYMASVNQQYNEFMRGVDLADAYLQRHLAKHRNRSWKKVAFFGITKKVVDNCHIIWNRLFTDHKMNQTQFQIQLAQGLAPSSTAKQPPNSKTHLFFKPMTGSIWVGKRGRCIICKDCSSAYRCSVCNVWIHEKCWDQQHPAE